jgi:hypothetical protein
MVMLCGLALAQSGAKLELFAPASLPMTTKPSPIPTGMTDLPANFPIMPERGGSCFPALEGLMVPVDVRNAIPDAVISDQILTIKNADQAARQQVTPNTDWKKIAEQDRERREALLSLIPRAVTGQDFAFIALVFQHGGCVSHYLLAHHLARMGADKNSLAKWLVAATLDRALMSVGRAQKYGTQYVPRTDQPRCLALYIVDPTTTDGERVALGVPTLQDAIRQSQEFNPSNC